MSNLSAHWFTGPLCLIPISRVGIAQLSRRARPKTEAVARMTTILVTDSMVGQLLASDGIVTAIRFITAPPAESYLGYFSLIDDSANGEPTSIFNIDVSTSWVTTENPIYSNELLAQGNISFGNLTLESCPSGSAFEVDFKPG